MRYKREQNIPADIKEEDFVFCKHCNILFDEKKWPPTKKGILGNRGFALHCPRCEKFIMDIEEITGSEE